MGTSVKKNPADLTKRNNDARKRDITCLQNHISLLKYQLKQQAFYLSEHIGVHNKVVRDMKVETDKLWAKVDFLLEKTDDIDNKAKEKSIIAKRYKGRGKKS